MGRENSIPGDTEGRHADAGGRPRQGDGRRRPRGVRAILRSLRGARVSPGAAHRGRSRGGRRGAARRLLGGMARRRRLRPGARHGGGMDSHARADVRHRPPARRARRGGASWRRPREPRTLRDPGRGLRGRRAGGRRARGADRRSWPTWAAATAVVAAAAAGFTGTWVAVRYEARLGQMARETAAVKEHLARNEASLRDQVTLYRGAVELLRDPATRVVDLRAQGPAPAASGRMIWNDVGGGHLFVAGLAPTPPGKTYALWTIVGGTPRPAGLFDVDAAGRGTLRIAPASTGAAARVFVVTVEPEGGVPAPTGPIVLASK